VSAEGFALDVAALAAACTDRARLLIINSPSNPTGAVMSAEQAGDIVELAERRRLYVVHDEVLDNFVYEGDHIPIRAVADTQRTILINSASKSLGMPGWRLGWLIGAREIVAAAAKAHTYIELAVGHLGQLALAALLEAQDLAEQLRARHVVMRDRIRRVQAELTQLDGFAFSYEPRAGFYLFPRVSELHRRLGADAQDQCAGDVVAARLLDHAGVATVSGSAFGRTGSDHIRISIAGADSQLDAALERIATVVGRLT
jgi:aspartate/methionine/tyrosine aminotransferase